MTIKKPLLATARLVRIFARPDTDSKRRRPRPQCNSNVENFCKIFENLRKFWIFGKKRLAIFILVTVTSVQTRPNWWPPIRDRGGRFTALKKIIIQSSNVHLLPYLRRCTTVRSHALSRARLRKRILQRMSTKNHRNLTTFHVKSHKLQCYTLKNKF